MLHFDSKWGIHLIKCTIAIVKLATELAFCGCYTTTSAPEYPRIFQKRCHFSHSDIQNPVSSQIHCCFRTAKHMKKNTKIGWKSAENRPLSVKIAIISCTLSPSAGCSTESDLKRSPRHQRYPPFWQSGEYHYSMIIYDYDYLFIDFGID